MNKIVMLVMGLLFTSRLFASIGPHITQLEHDAPILIRSAIIVGVAVYLIWTVVKYLKKYKASR
ncbi:hypothetical protein BCU70_03000 [Vibrio sp. 10N.286.49.C2]|uniref:hypothetical protein n=1 Tax=unclassified Vibrio TaxID=2614977 RepID=UPI000C864A85|nr:MULTISPECIES: hypothetical protein [unclassified Vibrio]PMH38256.1 hypothetical protein BCU70_03000 [Vibrio sp. 10N.286.49.C2]PMH55664.1 hypothetical protein BCU66_08595 [Vibrio sp. 10N.286.49.B1]PMH83452.1 hypothetical protein BCU58_01475 [Vibrio sp. 10N.286.48.B7]